jgi:Domain of unknown function (DUF4516)
MVNYLTANLVALAGLLTGASVVHFVYKPDLVRSNIRWFRMHYLERKRAHRKTFWHLAHDVS